MSRLATVLLGSLLALLVTWLSGCYRVSEYSGDGELVDRGRGAATNRYVLNLGPIDLTRRGTKTFRIANLPKENFVVGIEIRVAPEDQATIEKRLVTPTVSLALAESRGKILFTKTAALDAWTWGLPRDLHWAFVYGRGEPGTYFDALRRTEYTLTLDVLEPDRSQSTYTAVLMATSAGWL